ncbi:DNA-binding protein [Roseateles puraquae]|nr:DNA-binding protein [Roseateles puraquae]
MDIEDDRFLTYALAVIYVLLRPDMARPTIATPEEVRSTVLTLLAESEVPERPSRQSFRRAVSVRRVRERLGGGNPATIGREINALESELVQAAPVLATPEIPVDIADLMQQLWRAAVSSQVDDLVRMRGEAQAIADGARQQLTEAELRVEVLKQELAELRAAVADRDARIAQASTDLAAMAQQVQALQQDLQAAGARETEQRTVADELRANQAQAVAAARERYDGLSKRLLEETGQQRQAAQAEVARANSQLRFAMKRQEALEARLERSETELREARKLQQEASGEVSALRYVNTSLRAQIDEFVRSLPPPPPAPGLARGRNRVPKVAKKKAPRKARPGPSSE